MKFLIIDHFSFSCSLFLSFISISVFFFKFIIICRESPERRLQKKNQILVLEWRKFFRTSLLSSSCFNFSNLLFLWCSLLNIIIMYVISIIKICNNTTHPFIHNKFLTNLKQRPKCRICLYCKINLLEQGQLWQIHSLFTGIKRVVNDKILRGGVLISDFLNHFGLT